MSDHAGQSAMLNIDKMLNDLLEILAALDGRVKRLELKKSIKKRPSYISIVGDPNDAQCITDAIRIEHAKFSLGLLSNAVATVEDRLTTLEQKEGLP